MNKFNGSIITPLPTEEYIKQSEKIWGVSLPESYKDFVKKYSGLIPNNRIFSFNGRERLVERFLGLVENAKDNPLGMYDIDVVMTQIEERLYSDPDSMHIELLPIAALFGGDFLCLSFVEQTSVPKVYIWYADTSFEWEPSVELVTDNFESFIDSLHK
ncbi:SMI1/KNR4 family protein [Streptococcus suis]|uniref:SMI1/KNR4 family protein n=1 Tax=Streptococcus suis TaxID=1307 RepID=UPI000C18974E|nr:SMI1/KNR4 family protein [Streptococcus suis]MCQ8263478.1 SMI1/KNR4 family protein [Streptococcus suis]